VPVWQVRVPKVNLSTIKKINKNTLVLLGTIKKVKQQPIEWEKIFADHKLMKVLYAECIKNIYNSTIKRQPSEKIDKGLLTLNWIACMVTKFKDFSCLK
jgi:hypothetical protein